VGTKQSLLAKADPEQTSKLFYNAHPALNVGVMGQGIVQTFVAISHSF
jgi:hypothetical protein